MKRKHKLYLGIIALTIIAHIVIHLVLAD